MPGPAVAGEVQQPVGVEGVARPGPLEVEVEPLGGRRGRQPVVGCRGLLAGHAVLPGQSLDVVAFAPCRRVRIELEGPPHDVDLIGVFEPLQRGLEPALADGTPWAHHVRKNLYLHVCW